MASCTAYKFFTILYMNKMCPGTSFPLLHLHFDLGIKHLGMGVRGGVWGFRHIPKASLNGLNQHKYIPGHHGTEKFEGIRGPQFMVRAWPTPSAPRWILDSS